MHLLTTYEQGVRGIRILLILKIIVFSCAMAYGQVGIFISNGDSVYLHSNDSVSFFTNVQAEGVFSSKPESSLLFYGQNWQNSSSAKFPGNGWFVFAQPSSLGSDTIQNLGGANWDNRFPNIKLKNANNLHLVGVAGNRDTFQFDTGLVFHNKFDYVIGNNHPGEIIGFNQNKYFVTNHTNESDSGFLVRHTLSHSAVVYPVGADSNDYTPASLINNGVPDTFSVRVFPNVYTKGDSGVTDNVNSVARTWNILESTAGSSSVNLTLQHNSSTEGSFYNRGDQYIARYMGALNNAYKDTAGASFWDYAAPGNGDTNLLGTLTSNPTYGYMSERSIAITTDFSPTSPTRYFTKFSTASPPVPVELLYFTARWISKDEAKVEWSTASEINNERFVLYRSFDGKSYELLDVQSSKAIGGNSNEILQYSFEDYTIPETEEYVYYALEQYDYDNSRERFGPVALSKLKDNANIESKVYPNPAREGFHLSLVGSWKGEFEYALVNTLGEVLIAGMSNKTDYTFTTSISTLGFLQGNYWLRITPLNNRVTVKPISIIILN